MSIWILATTWSLTQTRSSVSAWAWVTPWSQVVAQAIHICMTAALVWFP